MAQQSLHEKKELISEIFERKISINDIFYAITDISYHNKIYRNFKIAKLPIPYICVCTTERMLGRSHFKTSVFLFMLECLGKAEFYRLGVGHDEPCFVQEFGDSNLTNEPLFLFTGETRDSSHEHKKADYCQLLLEELRAAEKIIEKYSVLNCPLHPLGMSTEN